MSNKRLTLTLSIGLSALLYLLFVLFADYRAVLEALSYLNVKIVVSIFIISLLNYVLRFWRWHTYVNALGHHLPPWRHFLYYLAGFTLTVTPGKAGEAVRSLYLLPHGVPYNHSLAALLVERLLDVLAISLLALLIFLALADYIWLVVVAWILTLGLIWIIARPEFPNWLRDWGSSHRFGRQLKRLARMLDSAAVLLRPNLFLFGLALGLIGWGLEGFSLYWIAYKMGLPISSSIGIGIYAIAVLAGALSFLPGGLGGTEAVMAGLLVALGADGSMAVAITLLCRLATLWFAVALGALAVLILGLIGQAPLKAELHSINKII